MKLVLVEWLDSHGTLEGWRILEEENGNPEPLKCSSVGWLLHDKKNCKVIIPHIAGGNSEQYPFQGRGELTIPVKSITKITELKTK